MEKTLPDLRSEKKEGILISEIIRIVATLIVITILIGGLITIVNFYTQPIIALHEAQKRQILAGAAEQLTFVKKVLPNADATVQLGEWEINGKKAPYFSAQKQGAVNGYAIMSYGKGYSSLIEILIGVDLSLHITGLDVISQAETPGLGERVMESEFKQQFIGKCLTSLKVTTAGESDRIQAITGATISSKAVTEDAVKNALLFLSSKHL
jgi:Na+-translocating ferredoxin:NAD+ oxidoreductase subunit G